MISLRMAALGLALSLTTLSSAAAPKDNKSGHSAEYTIAVADFSGTDKELGRFLADTLLTDLAQSDHLRMVERTEIRQALVELKLQSTGLTEPQQIKQVGKLVGADHLIVGSYLRQQDHLFVNARLLDVSTGRVVSGGAANVSGGNNDLMALVHRLAHTFHKRVTGEEIVLADENGEAAPHPEPPIPDAPAPAPTETAATDRSGWYHLIPGHARPDNLVREAEMASLLARVGPAGAARFFAVTDPKAPVSRLRALSALVKATLPTTIVAAYHETPTGGMPPDVSQIPLWGYAYVAAAMDRGWWPVGRPLHPRDPATWGFVRVILENMPQGTEAPEGDTSDALVAERPHRPAPDRESVGGGYTGLVVDARDLPVERGMSMRLVDEDGQVVYPDQKHLPDIDTLEDHGLCSYPQDTQHTDRAGERPLRVRALGLSGDDILISNAAAERIRAANRQRQFLWQWKVCVIVDMDR